VRCGAAAIEQPGSRQQHGAGADGSDASNSSSDGFQPADDSSVYFVILNRGAASHQQRIDASAHFAKCLVRSDSQTTVCDK
jgi:hypothetical protein